MSFLDPKLVLEPVPPTTDLQCGSGVTEGNQEMPAVSQLCSEMQPLKVARWQVAWKKREAGLCLLCSSNSTCQTEVDTESSALTRQAGTPDSPGLPFPSQAVTLPLSHAAISQESHKLLVCPGPHS